MATVRLWPNVIHQPLTDATDLANVDVTSYVNGALAHVNTLSIFSYDNASTETPNDITVIEPSVGPGRWEVVKPTLSAGDLLLGTTSTGGVAEEIQCTANARSFLAAATASAQRAVISAAASGANSDITSLSALSSPLSVGQGGSGAITLGPGILIGNGTSPFSTVTAPSGAVVGTTDSQTLTNKTIAYASNTLTGVATSGANSNITSLLGLIVPLDVPQGGTGSSSLNAYGVIIGGTTSTGALQSTATGATGSILRSVGTSNVPAWTTATYPATTTINRILYSSANDTISEIATLNNGVLITSGAGVPSISNTLPAAVQSNITGLTVPQGGTGVSSVNAYGVLFGGTTSTGAIQSVAAVASGSILRATGTTSLPAWTTATYPATTTANRILYSSANNTIGEITSANDGVLVTNGSGVPSISSTLPAAVMANINKFNTIVVQTFTASGTYTKSAGMVFCLVKIAGGGGSSGGVRTTGVNQNSSSGGGGAGGYAEGIFDSATIGASQAVTIGAGGTAGAAGNNPGNAGGNTTFGSLLTANGGNGGAAGFAPGAIGYSAAGAGGTASGGYINITGGNGTPGWGWSADITQAGVGGGNPLAPDSGVSPSGAGNAIAGKGYGGGASGNWLISSSSQLAGAAGASGVVIVTEFCNQ